MKPGIGGKPAIIAATRLKQIAMVSQLTVRWLAGAVVSSTVPRPIGAQRSESGSKPSVSTGASSSPSSLRLTGSAIRKKAEMAAVEPTM